MDETYVQNPQAPTEQELAALAKACTHPEKGKKKHRHKSYDQTVELAKEMAPHAFGTDPGEKLRDYRPNQPTEILEYRKRSYEPKTHQEFEKAEGAARRIFSDAVTGVDYPDNLPPLLAAYEPKKYFEGMFYDGKSVLHYMSQVALPVMLGDPNAAIVLLRVSADSETEPYRVKPVLYLCERVYDYRAEQYYLILTEEKSEVMVGQTPVMRGNVFLYINKTQTWRIIQVGQEKDGKYEAALIEQRTDEVITARLLGGVAISFSDHNFYKSFFAPAVPSWNVALRQYSDLQACIARAAFPQRVLSYMTCPQCNGEGKIHNETCGTCHGTGRIGGNVASPFTDIEIEHNRRDENRPKPADLVHVVPEDTTYLDFLQKSIKAEYESAMASLHLQAMEGVNELNSGRAKEIDRSDQNEFFKSIAAQAYDIVDFIYEAGMVQRYGEVSNISASELVPQVHRPLSFDFASVDTLIEESKRAKEAGLSMAYLKQVDRQIAIRQYGAESETALKIIATIDHDPYYKQNPEELMAANAVSQSTAVDPDQYFVSLNIDRIVTLAIERNKRFLFEDLDAQAQQVYTIAARIRPKPIAVPPMPEVE